MMRSTSSTKLFRYQDGILFLQERLKDLDYLNSPQTYPATIELFRQSSWPQEVFLINSGLIKLIHQENDGREMIIGLRLPGWLVGSFSAIIQKPYPVTAITLTSCSLQRIPSSVFL